MKIIDHVKAYIRQKKGRDGRSTGFPLDGAADPAPAQRDRARHEQNRDDKRPHETPEPNPAAESATDPVTESVNDPVTGSVNDLVTGSVNDPVTGSVNESATEPATEPANESATEPITESATAPAACPRCGATGEAPCTTPSGKATKTHKGREQ